MKTLITYSSKTGNTKAVAEAIAQAITGEIELLEISKVQNIDNYDKIVVGFWVDKGTANTEALKFIESIHNKTVGYFFTLGAAPDGQHAKDCHNIARELFEKNGNTVLNSYHCQGAVDPKLIEQFKKFPKGHFHYVDEKKLAFYAEAAKHPDSTDLENAKKAFESFGK